MPARAREAVPPRLTIEDDPHAGDKERPGLTFAVMDVVEIARLGAVAPILVRDPVAVCISDPCERPRYSAVLRQVCRFTPIPRPHPPFVEIGVMARSDIAFDFGGIEPITRSERCDGSCAARARAGG